MLSCSRSRLQPPQPSCSADATTPRRRNTSPTTLHSKLHGVGMHRVKFRGSLTILFAPVSSLRGVASLGLQAGGGKARLAPMCRSCPDRTKHHTRSHRCHVPLRMWQRKSSNLGLAELRSQPRVRVSRLTMISGDIQLRSRLLSAQVTPLRRWPSPPCSLPRSAAVQLRAAPVSAEAIVNS